MSPSQSHLPQASQASALYARWGSLFFGFLLLLLFLVLPAAVATVDHGTRLQEAIDAVVEKGDDADDEYKAIVFRHNREINRLALRGRPAIDGATPLTDAQYQILQEVFRKKNQELAKDVLAELGFEGKFQEPPKRRDDPGEQQQRHNPGTDTDIIIQRLDGKSIALADVLELDKRYQQRVDEYLQDNDPDWAALRHIPVKTNTDFMPHPDHTDDFVRISEMINARDGTAYVRKDAAYVEDRRREPNGVQFAVFEAGEYVREMHDQVRRAMDNAGLRYERVNQLEKYRATLEKSIDALERQIAAAESADERQRYAAERDEKRSELDRIGAEIEELKTDIQLFHSMAGKYLDRMVDMCQRLARQHRIECELRLEGRQRELLEQLSKVRGPKTRDQAGAMKELAEPILQLLLESYVDTLAKLVPESPDLAMEAFAELALMSDLRRDLHPRFAQIFDQRIAGLVTPPVIVQPQPSMATGAERVRAMCSETRRRGLTQDEAMARMRGYLLDWDTLDPHTMGDQVPRLDDFVQQASEEWGNWQEGRVRSGMHLFRYGNWYAPNWWGGSELKDRVGPLPPVDSLDAIAMRHDFAYQIAEEMEQAFANPRLGQELRAMADIIAMEEALMLPGDPRDWPHPPQDPEDARKMRALMVYGFSVLAPMRTHGLSAYFELKKTEEDLWTALTSPALSAESMEATMRAMGLDRVEYTITPEQLSQMAQNRAFQWFLRYGKTEEDLWQETEGALAHLLDASGARIRRSQPAMPDEEPGSAVFSLSGQWESHNPGWLPPFDPSPNRPIEAGPIALEAGRYKAHLLFAPDIRHSMTAGNYNTGMSVQQFVRGHSLSGTGRSLVGLSASAGNRPQGEIEREFVVDRPSQARVRFGVAASHGHAGGYVEHEQSFTGTIIYLGPIPEEVAEPCSPLMPGDTLRAGRSDVTLALANGAVMRVPANSEVRMETNDEGGLRVVVVNAGSGGTFRTEGEDFDEFEVEDPSGQVIRVRPLGTTFTVTATGIEVLEGSVEVLSGPGLRVIRKGQRIGWEDESAAAVDAPDERATLSSDGIPLQLDFWQPRPEPFGAKPGPFEPTVEESGWLWADPPARWYRSFGNHAPRAEVEVDPEGSARVTVPAGSSLDDRRNTAPRLLHKITGDFDLEAEVSVQGPPHAVIEWIVRAPGSHAGTLAGQFPGTGADGPGQHYLQLGASVGLARDASLRVAALNEPNRDLWPSPDDDIVRIRLSRRGSVWTAAWRSADERWNVHRLEQAPQVPETFWAGWAFINPARTESAQFTVRNVRLHTVPWYALPRPEWQGFAVGGRIETAADTAVLSVDAGLSGSARALRGQVLEGDFDVSVHFDARELNREPGQVLRWTLGAVTLDEQGVSVGYEWSDRGASYGVVRETRPGYRAATAMHRDPLVVEERTGRLRLVRRGDVIHAYYWRNGPLGRYREISYRDQDRGGFEGPMHLRVALDNGDRLPDAGSATVAFTVVEPETSIGEALVREIHEHWVLDADQTIAGSVIHTAGRINLNGHRLVIEGLYQQAGGDLRVNGGELHVHGDYRIEGLPEGSDDGPEASSGTLTMTSDQDRVFVAGDFVTRSTRAHHNNLRDGVLEVRGDFVQDGDPNSFDARLRHRVVLSGDSRQDVVFANPDRSGFQQLTVTHDQVYVSSPLRGWQLDSDVVLNTDDDQLFPGFTQTLNLNGQTLELRGGVLQQHRARINLAGGRLIVRGDLIQPAAEIWVNGGMLWIDGDYRIEPLAEDGQPDADSSDGTLRMNRGDDLVRVGGHFVTRSAHAHHNNLIDGVLEVRGDFVQAGHPNSFDARLRHKVVLTGSQPQTLRFESPAASGFQTLILDPKAAASGTVPTDVRVRKLVQAPVESDPLRVPVGGRTPLAAPWDAPDVGWTAESRDPEIATIDDAGEVTGKASGWTALKLVKADEPDVFRYRWVDVIAVPDTEPAVPELPVPDQADPTEQPERVTVRVLRAWGQLPPRFDRLALDLRTHDIDLWSLDLTDIRRLAAEAKTAETPWSDFAPELEALAEHMHGLAKTDWR